jgi:hypothetical protein
LIVSKSASGGLLVCAVQDRVEKKNVSGNKNIHRLLIKASPYLIFTPGYAVSWP